MEKKMNISSELLDIKNMYQESAGNSNFSALVMGLFGVGKTSFIATGRKPILIYSFDPKGTLVLKDQIEKGDVFVIPFWNENSKKPTEYRKFEKLWQSHLASGFLENFGTVAIDSMTTLIEALSNEIARMKNRAEGVLAIQDYQPLYNTVRDIVKQTSIGSFDFFVTGHLVATEDGVTGEISYELDTYKQLKSRLPLLFTEKYVLMTVEKPSGLDRVLLTASKRRYRASTQLGKDGKFKTEEIPDIKNLLKKAGITVEDKEKLLLYPENGKSK